MLSTLRQKFAAVKQKINSNLRLKRTTQFAGNASSAKADASTTAEQSGQSSSHPDQRHAAPESTGPNRLGLEHVRVPPGS